MTSKVTLDFYCHSCGSEYMVTFDQDNQIEEPVFCTFCAESMEKDLDFDEDD